MWHTLAHALGLDNESGPIYAFWSGFGSDIAEITLIGAVIGAARAHNCHVRGCWRLGKHPVADGLYKVCRRHHPTVPDGGVTVEDVHAAHRATQV